MIVKDVEQRKVQGAGICNFPPPGHAAFLTILFQTPTCGNAQKNQHDQIICQYCDGSREKKEQDVSHAQKTQLLERRQAIFEKLRLLHELPLNQVTILAVGNSH